MECFFQMLYYILAVAFVIPLSIILYAYITTGRVLYRSVREARSMMGHTDRFEIFSVLLKISLLCR